MTRSVDDVYLVRVMEGLSRTSISSLFLIPLLPDVSRHLLLIYGPMDVDCGKSVPAIRVDVESFELMCPLAGPVQLPQLLQYVLFFFSSSR